MSARVTARFRDPCLRTCFWPLRFKLNSVSWLGHFFCVSSLVDQTWRTIWRNAIMSTTTVVVVAVVVFKGIPRQRRRDILRNWCRLCNPQKNKKYKMRYCCRACQSFNNNFFLAYFVTASIAKARKKNENSGVFWLREITRRRDTKISIEKCVRKKSSKGYR